MLSSPWIRNIMHYAHCPCRWKQGVWLKWAKSESLSSNCVGWAGSSSSGQQAVHEYRTPKSKSKYSKCYKCESRGELFKNWKMWILLERRNWTNWLLDKVVQTSSINWILNDLHFLEHSCGSLLKGKARMKYFEMFKMVFVLVVSLLMVVVEGGSSVSSSFVTQNELRQRNCSLVRGLHANLIRFITKEGFHRFVPKYQI